MVPQPRVLVVGGTTPGAYPTIAAALAAARPGDTVDVPIGEYREPVALKSGVTLRSRVPREAVLLAPVGAQEVRGAKLIGFSIRLGEAALDGAAVYLVRSEVELDDNEVEHAETGVEIIGGGPAVLIGNAVHDCGVGVRINGPLESWLSHNSFQRNNLGLVAVDGARPSLIGNIFDKSPLELPPDMDLKAVWEKNFRLDAAPPARRARPEPKPTGDPQ